MKTIKAANSSSKPIMVSDEFFDEYKKMEKLYQSILDKIIKERVEGREKEQYRFSGVYLSQLFNSAVYKNHRDHNQAYIYFKRLMYAPFYKDIYDDINRLGGFLFMKHNA